MADTHGNVFSEEQASEPLDSDKLLFHALFVSRGEWAGHFSEDVLTVCRKLQQENRPQKKRSRLVSVPPEHVSVHELNTSRRMTGCM